MKIQKNPIHRRSTHARRGFTMIETLASVSAATVLLSINAVWIYQTLKFSSRVNQRHRNHQSLTRLASDFRDDVWSCETIEIVGQNEIKLTSPTANAANWSANYKIVGTDVLLNKQTAGSQVKQERFSLSPNSVIRWDESEMPKAISLLVSRDPNKFPDRQSEADQTVDSADSMNRSPTPDQELITLLQLRVSPNRWAIGSSPAKPKFKTKPETSPETKPGAEPESTAESAEAESNHENAEEVEHATN